MVLGVLGRVASILFVVFVKLGFDVYHTLILSLQGMLPYLRLLLPYLISILLAQSPRHEYLGLNLLVGFAHLELQIVVAWRLFVVVVAVVLGKDLVEWRSVVAWVLVLVVAVELGMDLVEKRTVVAWGQLVVQGFVVLVVEFVLGMGLVRKGLWLVEHLVVVAALLSLVGRVLHLFWLFLFPCLFCASRPSFCRNLKLLVGIGVFEGLSWIRNVFVVLCRLVANLPLVL